MISESIKWDEKGLVTAVIQDCKTSRVLMVAYMNEEALMMTLATGRVHFFSRSRNRLWMKGETSGNVQYLKDVKIDCDGDALLLKVEQTGVACHTGNESCFYRSLKEQSDNNENENMNNDVFVLQELYDVVMDRKKNPTEGSYTCSLFKRGLDVILKKVGEESAEVIIAAKNNKKDEVIYEISDLLYHLTVLLVEQGISLDEIYGQLRDRR